MKNIKTIFVLVITFSFIQCNSLKLESSPSFKITGATYNYWIGGQPGVSGIKVNIGVQSDSEIIFEKIYFQKRAVKIEIRTFKEKTYLIGHFDTSTRKDPVVIDDISLPKPVVKQTEFSFELKENEAVISYKQGNKIKYFKIINLKKTKTDFYP